jgi:hypothetical protein
MDVVMRIVDKYPKRPSQIYPTDMALVYIARKIWYYYGDGRRLLRGKAMRLCKSVAHFS